ncbi:copper resistance protein B [Micavibrio aeruginosavorus]|uniref:Copper resistance B family protein n=1 Tax=Micavibrio aeruginosavorus (strain ARL-13) TaxID=856793 RepID=G2KRL5_MICAA|nr:copper resistance protein B [Micavibrio aeruginosavorus]AEP09577.1 copper resistance B family protein [Micavibrio aeruginosavorus ARL-13]
MHTKPILAALLLLSTTPAFAQDPHAGHVMTAPVPAEDSSSDSKEAMTGGGHGHNQLFHAFRLETDYGAGTEGPVASWGFDGWIGGDYNKLALKIEGEHGEGKLEQAEFWALYSRNVAPFWDLQAGIRHDTQPQSTTYFVFGTEGLAPYFFETEAHLFLSEDGDLSARISQENDFLITQRLILQPYAEIELSAQDIPEKSIGAGLTHGEIGLQTRYEITRKFAPYVDFRYERKFGETSSIAKDEGEDNDDFIAAVGLRLMF